ncbi:alginate lyase [Saccharobesus litoralis]|uniref:Alginate lyase n=1 Tax=Saccharobesus litoralis TaxID=2172099 RepID=A0A2S0VMJ8_9ALTE|nr:heparinase II/III family protein [Saccharobesus litoralis]AWB65425.1 alginate lyase [Saccharobesus litoralis]
MLKRNQLITSLWLAISTALVVGCNSEQSSTNTTTNTAANTTGNDIKPVTDSSSSGVSSLVKQVEVAHPKLVVTAQDVLAMREGIATQGLFRTAFLQQKAEIDKVISQPIDVPMPKDAGGGYTHERHKKNYAQMYQAGIIYQLTQQQKYADFVRDMLLQYADLYPSLPLHPKRKSANEGRLFWQGLNEAVWLVHTAQAYDFVKLALNEQDQKHIETNALRPVALFLSEQSPHTFNKVHNHGTWATAAVGLTGYVLGEQDWVEKALLDLDKSGKGGFLRQMDELFSPEGYYNEGPYYQRYALMPFVIFAKAIDVNEPNRKIFEYRNGVLLKAIKATVELSYNGLFYPINDAIKSKGIDTIELVNGVAIAYGLTAEAGLLDIAQQQNQILLTGDGFKVAQALEAGKAQAYQFKSIAYGDGKNADEGAFVIMRQNVAGEQAAILKATAQGLGHGHFDKLTWQFYDKGAEVVTDYGAARFLNVESKYGGRYLPENETYAKQTVAHNTLVVDETSHFNMNLDVANANHPELLFFENTPQVKLASAQIATAYDDVVFKRTLALVNFNNNSQSLVFDLLNVKSDSAHQYDLPVHYQGHVINSNFDLGTTTNGLSALGKANGYQHLWKKSHAQPKGSMTQLTWLNDNGRFYTHSSVNNGESVMLTQIGANDPLFNLRNENGFIFRVKGKKQHNFVSVLEPHGEYNPSKEYTLDSYSAVQNIEHSQQGNIEFVVVTLVDNSQIILAINHDIALTEPAQFSYRDKTYQFNSRFQLFERI